MAKAHEIQLQLDRDLQEIRKLLTGKEWAQWTNFLKKKRKPVLQNQVNQFVREGELTKAQIALSKMDDCDRQIELFGTYIKDLEEEAKKGEA